MGDVDGRRGQGLARDGGNGQQARLFFEGNGNKSDGKEVGAAAMGGGSKGRRQRATEMGGSDGQQRQKMSIVGWRCRRATEAGIGEGRWQRVTG